MTFRQVTLETRDDVSVIRLNDPATLNAVTPLMLEELARAFRSAAAGSRAILLSSVGRAFSSGLNLKAGATDADEDAGLLLETHLNPLIDQLRSLPVPWIAAVRGPVVGVACSIALAADMVLASDTAAFHFAFARLGLVPDAGASWLLVRTLGRVRAMELMLFGGPLSADLARDGGLINRVMPDHDLDAAAFDLAARIAAGPTRAYALIRDLSWTAADQPLVSVLAAERAAQRHAGFTEDAREGRAALAGKRPPIFHGR